MAATSSANSKPPVMGYPTPPSYPPIPPNQATQPYPTSQQYSATQPYPAAQPYPVYPYTQSPPSHNHYQPSLFLRRLISVFIAVFMIVGSIILIIWLVFRPHLPRASISDASVSSFNISSTQLTATWDLTFTINNPNKKISIFYDHMKAAVAHNGNILAQTALPPFLQGRKNSTLLHTRLEVFSEYTGVASESDIASQRRKGEVGFDVRLLSFVRFRAGGWWTRWRYMVVICGDTRFHFSGSSSLGHLSNKPKECKVVF